MLFYFLQITRAVNELKNWIVEYAYCIIMQCDIYAAD